MGEGQPRYSTEIPDVHTKYMKRTPLKLDILRGDATNMQEKTWTGFKYGLFSGLSAAGLMSSQNSPVLSTKSLETSIKYGTPWVISGTIYGLTLSTVANLRKEDDYWNHICGGLASGAFMGSWFKSRAVGGWCAVVFAVTGAMFKGAADTGTLPDYPIIRSRNLGWYRTGWFIDRPNPEGVQDYDKDDCFRTYRP